MARTPQFKFRPDAATGQMNEAEVAVYAELLKGAAQGSLENAQDSVDHLQAATNLGTPTATLLVTQAMLIAAFALARAAGIPQSMCITLTEEARRQVEEAVKAQSEAGDAAD